jgi:hypothetical protein
MGAPLVLTDYWDERFGHRPYTGMLHEVKGDRCLDYSEVIQRAIEEAGAVDGDEVVITVVKTGRRPFGGRRMRWTAAHTYEREPLVEGDSAGEGKVK